MTSVRAESHSGNAGFAVQVLLGVALVSAAAVRCGLIFSLGAHHTDAGAYEHAEIAGHLARGEGFALRFYGEEAQPTGHQAPAVPWILSLCYRAWGMDTPQARAGFLLFNVALGMVGVAAMYGIGSMMWNRRVGIWAAFGTALYPPLAYTATRIQAVNWSVAWMLVTLGCVMAARRRGSVGWGVCAGLAGGVALLGEPVLSGAFALVWLAVFVAAMRERPRRWAAPLAICLFTGLVVGPWVLRNAAVHGRFVPIKSAFWYSLWQGNHLEGTGTDKLLPDEQVRRKLAWSWGFGRLEGDLARARAQADSVDTLLADEDRREIRRRGSEIEKMDWFRDRALRTIAEHPGHYLRMCGRRLWQMVWFDPTNPRSYVLPYRLCYLALLLLAATGMLVSVRHRPRLWHLPVLVAVGLLAVHALVITSARFRLPLEALLVLPAAVVPARIGSGRTR